MADSYSEFEIHVGGKQGDGRYPVWSKLDDGSGFQDWMVLDEAALREVALKPAAYGRLLFKALLPGDNQLGYYEALNRAIATNAGRMRVRLWLDDEAPELQGLAWERLYHLYLEQLIPLATTASTPFSRYVRLNSPDAQAVKERPVNFLLAVANPEGLPPGFVSLNVEQEVQSLLEALGTLARDGRFRLAVMPGRSGLPAPIKDSLIAEGIDVIEGPCTLEGLLRHLPDYHVLHFLGHGARGRRDPGQVSLYLEDEAGHWSPVPASKLVPRVANLSRRPVLIFLAACETGATLQKSGHPHPHAGLAQQLVGAGIPAVLAMQERVPLSLAREMAREFYRPLLSHGLADVAANQAATCFLTRRILTGPSRFCSCASVTGACLTWTRRRTASRCLFCHRRLSWSAGRNY